jgi:hypothetical protein
MRFIEEQSLFHKTVNSYAVEIMRLLPKKAIKTHATWR